MSSDVRPIIGIVDDEKNIHLTLSSILQRRDYETLAAFTGKQGLAMIEKNQPHLVLLDLGLPDGEGLSFLKTICHHYPNLPVLVLTANDSLNNAIESIKIGAFHFLSKPYVPEELLSLVKQALETSYLRRETKQLREETSRLKKKMEHVEKKCRPIFRNFKMVELDHLATQVAPTDANVLLVGESGVGKEVFANLLHQRSLRTQGPIVQLNCAAFPASMIEAELFGYKKGAFTGALKDFPGMLHAASEGTLFLDEIAEMPIELQTRFLRVLQERNYRSLGSTQFQKSDFRLIAACNRRPDEAIEEGILREDLFYRLNTFIFSIPPLRDRLDDIPELAEQFLQRFCAKMNKQALKILPETYEVLLNYPWPGNVRELQNVIERATVLARGDQITPENLPPEMLPSSHCTPAFLQKKENTSAAKKIFPQPSSLPSSFPLIQEPPQTFNLAKQEKATLLAALDKCHGNKKKAAQLLGIHRPTLYSKLKKYDLNGALPWIKKT